MRAAGALSVVALAAASCSESRLQPDASGQLQPDAGGADATIPSGGFITAEVDGVTIRAEMQAVSYWWSGLQEGWIEADAKTAELQWVLILQNLTGPATSGYAVLQPVDAPTAGRASYNTGGVFAVDVTSAALDVGYVLAGTFTATIARLGGSMPATVSNGAFILPRIAGMPPPQ
jgi:hypothetical protein